MFSDTNGILSEWLMQTWVHSSVKFAGWKFSGDGEAAGRYVSTGRLPKGRAGG